MKKRTVRVLTWIGIAVATMGALYAVLLGLANRGLHRAYAALEADGRPMKAEQVIPAPVPNGENAALIYQSVVLQLKAEPGVEQELFAELGDLAARIVAEQPERQAEEQFKALCKRQALQDTMAALRRGTMKSGCRYDLDYSKGAGILLPHLADLRNLSRILCAKARLSAKEGNAAQAWDDVIASLRLANALYSEPLHISQLVRIAQFSLAADSISAVAVSGAPSQQQYDDILQILSGFEDAAPFVSAMDGERLLLGEWAFALPRSELRKTAMLGDGAAMHFIVFASIFPPLLQRDHTAYLTVMHAYAKNASRTYSTIDAELGEQMLQDVPRYCILTRMLAPALSAAKGRYVSMVARARVTRTSLAVLRHAKAKGGYPEHLDAIRPGAPIDPFTGRPLIYRTTPSGFVVYSVGENLTDDGGTTAKDRRDGDIVWNYRTRKTAEPEN